MSGKRPLGADNKSPDRKRLKTEEEDGDDFPYGKRVAILRSYRKPVCHVSTRELQKILKYNSSDLNVHHEFKGLDIEIHDFHIEEDLVRFLAHWTHHRDSEVAISATMEHSTGREEGALNEDRLVYLIRAMNFFDDPFTFTCDITDSLVYHFLELLNSGGLERIDQVYRICKDSSKTPILASVFASVFVHRKKQFAQQSPTCEHDRAIQSHMYTWLADALVNDGDWGKLPSQFQVSDEGRGIDLCFHHRHGGDKNCYFDGRIVKSG